MEFEGMLDNVKVDFVKGTELTFTSRNIPNNILDEYIRFKDKVLNIKFDIKRNKRSLDSNAYAWVLMQKLAEKLNTTKDEIYLEELRKHSRSFTHVIVHEKAVPKFKEIYRTVVELGTVSVNGKEGVQLQCYYGSSTFDTKEMSVFLNGIVEDCKELDIETLPPDEIKRMNEMWNKKERGKGNE